jgi:hypothetical protein
MQALLAESSPAVRVPDAASLLDAWESSLTQPPAQRALAIVAVAVAGALSAEQAGALPVGERDRKLLELREALFGSRVDCTADCPRCGEPIDVMFSVGDVLLAPQRAPETITVAIAGTDVAARVPTAADLAAIAQLPDGGDPRGVLLARCLPQASLPELSSEAADALAAALADADPQADVQIALDCPCCEQRWSAPFDIATHLIAELDAWAQRILWEVHVLACRYGWREPDTLRLSPTRRRFYLEALSA